MIAPLIRLAFFAREQTLYTPKCPRQNLTGAFVIFEFNYAGFFLLARTASS